jgi:hypothetical protein
MSAMPVSKAVDLDKELGMVVTERMPTKEIKLLGKEWTIICDLNSFAMAQIAGGDPGGISKFLMGLVIEEQREDFAATLSAAKGLDGEKLGALLSRLIEVAAERPTESPSPSRSTPRARMSTAK